MAKDYAKKPDGKTFDHWLRLSEEFFISSDPLHVDVDDASPVAWVEKMLQKVLGEKAGSHGCRRVNACSIPRRLRT